MKLHLILLLTISLACASKVFCDEQHQHHHDMGEEEKIGTVNFPIQCNAQAQEKFSKAVALLHSFAYEEAEEVFQEVAAADPKCAMAYWGVAMSNFHPLWAAPTPAEATRGMEAFTKLKSLTAETQREKDYIAAISAFYQDADKATYADRKMAYHKGIEQVYTKYPDDKEAAIFYALSLNATASPKDKTYANQKKAVQILEKILKENPDHPGVYHYIIHNYDYPDLANLALPAARQYSKIAPAVPHVQHMPSHIFTRLGLWEESVQSNVASAAAGKALMNKTEPGATHYDAVHAMDYLVYAYLQMNQDQKANKVLDEMRDIKKVSVQTFSVAYAYAVSPARYAVERGQWKEAAKLTLIHENFPWNKYSYGEANLYFARALGAAKTGDVDSAKNDVKKLESIRQALIDAKDPFWPDQIEIQRLSAAGWIAFAEGNKEEALSLIQKAADLEDSTEKHPVTPGPIIPAREQLGNLLLELNKPQDALEAYENSLAKSPNRLNGLYGAARAAEVAQNSEKATRYYSQLIELTKNGDGNREQLKLAKKFLAAK
jgi:tetratricopeptide (TPR) repeat protein